MKGKILLTTIAVLAVLFAGCGLKNDVVIKINNTTISKAQFDKLYNKQAKSSPFAKMRIDLKKDKNNIMALMIKDRITNELIIRTLLNEEMTKRGIKVTKEDVNNAVKDIIDKVGSKEQLGIILKQQGISNSQFRKDLEEEIKIKKLVEQLGSSSVSDAEAQKYYYNNIEKFRYPEKVRASHILIAANPKEIEEIIISDTKNKNLTKAQIDTKVNEELKARQAKANDLYNKAKANINEFAKFARENSEDPVSAEKGGDLGFFAKKDMVPEFSNVAFNTRPNTISNVVKTKYGYHIILVTDRMAAGQQPFEKVKENIKGYLASQKQLKLLDNLIESIKKNAKIEYLNDDYNPAKIHEKLQNIVKEQQKSQKIQK